MSVACIGYLIRYVFNSIGSHSTLEIILLFVISRVETLTEQHTYILSKFILLPKN